MESLDIENDDDQLPRSRAGRAKAAAILTGRVTAGLIGLGVAVVTIGALVTISVRRVKLAFASACPEREIFELVARRL